MLKAALIALAVALVAAVVGFGGIASAGVWIAQVLFVVFLVLLVVNFVQRAAA